MTNYVYWRDGGKTNEEGLGKLLSTLFSGGVATVASATSLQVTQDTGSNMSMKVAIGVGQIPYSTYAFPVGTDAIATVTGAASDPSNPRNSILVAYVDLSVVSSASNNNPGALKFLVVNGTAAAVPVDPTDPTIQTAVGGTNPFIKLARVVITTGATAITNAMITDLRTPITLQSAIGAGLVTTSALADDAVTAAKIDWASTGANAGIWWEELGRSTLGAAGDTITLNPIAARKYLRIIVIASATGGTINARLRFNNDSGANYSERSSANGGADGTAVSQTSMGLSATASAADRIFEGDIRNIAAQEKLLMGTTVEQGTAGAANTTSRAEIANKWANTANQITRIDVINTGTGDFAIGSEVVVLGHD